MSPKRFLAGLLLAFQVVPESSIGIVDTQMSGKEYKCVPVVFERAKIVQHESVRISASQFQKWFKADYWVGGERMEIGDDPMVFGSLVVTNGDDILVMPFYSWGRGDNQYYACQSHMLGEPPMFSVQARSREAFLRNMKSQLKKLSTKN